MPSKKILVLVVDDDIRMLRMMQRIMELEGYRVLSASGGEAALNVFNEETPDLMLLDVRMPSMDGYTVCRCIREFSQIPIIMVTVRGNDEEKVQGLDAGADDYVTKPFSSKELAARVRAVLRRTQAVGTIPTKSTFSSGDLEINFVERRVIVAGNEVNLTPTEYKLLQELVLNAGKVLTYTHLLNKVWGSEYRNEKEYLHVYTGRLRAKLEPDPTSPKYILTAPGVGYQFKN